MIFTQNSSHQVTSKGGTRHKEFALVAYLELSAVGSKPCADTSRHPRSEVASDDGGSQEKYRRRLLSYNLAHSLGVRLGKVCRQTVVVDYEHAVGSRCDEPLSLVGDIFTE